MTRSRLRSLPRSTALALPLLLTPLLLTACSSTAAPAASPAASPSAVLASSAARISATPAASASAAGPSLSVKTGAQLCALVPVAAAEAAERAEPAFAKQEGMTGSYDDPECTYTSADDDAMVMVLVYPSSEVAESPTHSYLNQVSATAIPDLGAAASGSTYEVDVDLGGGHTLIAYCPTELGTPRAGTVTTAGLTALAKLFVEKLS